MKYRNYFIVFAVAILFCASCGKNDNKATTMCLIKTVGDVGVEDADGESVALMDNLGLYSGYGIGTESDSFAWINLDDTKLTKMDEKSRIKITKNTKDLEIFVDSGSLFFNVTEPLKDDESMGIRTSTMICGIRGTCGWIKTTGDGDTTLYVLEGIVECRDKNGNTEKISRGQKARITNKIEVEQMELSDIPNFVLQEERPEDGFGGDIHFVSWEDSGLEEDKAESDGSMSNEEGVPWDNMMPVNTKDFPAKIGGGVDENEVFFPDILFPSEYTKAEGICYARLYDLEYSAYAYVETHYRTIADWDGLYFEQVGDFIIYVTDWSKSIEIKDTAHDYLMTISPNIRLADDVFMDEYLLKNCDYIKEQLSEYVIDNAENMENGTSDSSGLRECDIVPCGVYDLDENRYVIVSGYDDDDSGECMLMFARQDMYGPNNGTPLEDFYYNYFDLENIRDNTYSATSLSDNISVTVIFSDGGMDLSGGTGGLEQFNGHYTLQNE